MGIINGVKNPAPTPKDNTIPVLVTAGVFTALKANAALVDQDYVKRTITVNGRIASVALAGIVIPGTVYCVGYMLARSSPNIL